MKMTDFWDVAACKLADVSAMLTVFIVRTMIEAVSISETSVSFYKSTQCNLPTKLQYHFKDVWLYLQNYGHL
jgi:hypothetical protein